LPTRSAEPTFMGMPDTLTPVYWTAEMARRVPEDGNRYEVLQPDVFVVPVEQARMLDWRAIRDLLLVAEVLSPSTPRHDRFTKRRRYQEAGVPLYWIVDGDARQVEVWTPEISFPHIERQRLIWQPAGIEVPFTLSLTELFRAVE
jgi:Uma2 family endonuclease